MRKLRYTVELPDGAHEDHQPVSLSEAESLLKTMDWSPMAAPADASSKPVTDGDFGEAEPRLPFLLFLDEGESFFMLMPEPEGVRVVARVLDKWGLLGMSRQKSYTLEFGLLSREDASVLLKLFYEDNYPALRAIEKEMQGRPGT